MKKYTQDQKDKMVELRQNGMILKDIAKLLNINNLATIRQVCNAAGLPKHSYSKKIKYAAGQRYNNFVLIKLAYNKECKNENKKSIPYWECKCDCGNTFFISTKHMRSRQKSCGCLSKSNRFKKISSKDMIGNCRYNTYKSGAIRRGLKLNLTKDQFIELLFSNCYYCQSSPLTLVKTKNHKAFVNGIDRVNSNLDYTIDNCVACCKFCNRAKGDATLKEFLLWINSIKGNI